MYSKTLSGSWLKTIVLGFILGCTILIIYVWLTGKFTFFSFTYPIPRYVTDRFPFVVKRFLISGVAGVICLSILKYLYMKNVRS